MFIVTSRLEKGTRRRGVQAFIFVVLTGASLVTVALGRAEGLKAGWHN
jgi:hypothetical protein